MGFDDLAELQPAIGVARQWPVAGSYRGDDERSGIVGFGRPFCEQFEDLDDRVGRVGAVDDDDGLATEVGVEDEDEDLGPRPGGASPS